VMKRKHGAVRRSLSWARPAGGRPAMTGPARARAARRRSAWVRRGVLAAVLLAVVFFPVPGPVSVPQAATCHGCRAPSANAERWHSRLSGSWAAHDGATGTVPVSGQAYAAVGGGVAVVGNGVTVTGYRLRDGQQLWQVTLGEPAGAAIMSVRAWPGVVTAGVVTRDGRTRTEVVIDAVTGTVLAGYPAAVFGGAVAASTATTVVVGPTGVTSYDNGNGRIRWQRRTGAGQTWRTDGGNLYVAEAAGGYLGSAPVTSLRVIDLSSGTERRLLSPPGHSFSGTLAIAADDAVLFTSAAGVTADSGSTGGSRRSLGPPDLPDIGWRCPRRCRSADRCGQGLGLRLDGRRLGGHVRGARGSGAGPGQRAGRRGLGLQRGCRPGHLDGSRAAVAALLL